MLEGILKIGDIIIVIVGIGEETVACRKHIRRTHIRRRQEGLGGVADGENLLGIVIEILSELIPEVGVRIAVADNLYRFVAANRTMISGENNRVVAVSQSLKQFRHHGMVEPTERDATIGTLVIGQFAHHLRLGTGM